MCAPLRCRRAPRAGEGPPGDPLRNQVRAGSAQTPRATCAEAWTSGAPLPAVAGSVAHNPAPAAPSPTPGPGPSAPAQPQTAERPREAGPPLPGWAVPDWPLPGRRGLAGPFRVGGPFCSGRGRRASVRLVRRPCCGRAEPVWAPSSSPPRWAWGRRLGGRRRGLAGKSGCSLRATTRASRCTTASPGGKTP